MATVSAAEFAKKVGVSKERVSKGIQAGILTASVKKEKRGTRTFYKIDLKKGLQEWADNIDPAKQRDTSKQMETRALDDATGKGGQSQYQRAKAVTETYKAKLAQLDYEEKAGKLVPAAQVKAEGFKIARNVRDALMGLPERVSAELANMKEPREIAIYLRAQLAESLKDLADIQNAGHARK